MTHERVLPLPTKNANLNQNFKYHMQWKSNNRILIFDGQKKSTLKLLPMYRIKAITT